MFFSVFCSSFSIVLVKKWTKIMAVQLNLILEKEQQGIRVHLQEAHDKELDRWIAERHYLRSVPCGARLRLWIFGQERNIIGAMMWGRPNARMLDQERILELTRMYFIDNTEIYVESRGLALARKYIRKHLPWVMLCLSYSSEEGGDHCGTVFAADNWCPFGYTTGGSWKSKGRENRKDRDASRKVRWVRSP